MAASSGARNLAMMLPPEILDTICEHVSRSDLRALRLTSTAWQPSADKVLFDVIYLKFSGASFQRLQNISGHAKFCKLVHHIHYDSRQLENAPAFMKRSLDLSNDHYLSSYTRVANAQRLAKGVTPRLEFVEALTQFQEFQSNFLDYAAAQRSLSRDGNGRNTLRICISKLVNLLGVRHSFHEIRAPLWHLPRFEGPDPVSGRILGELNVQTSSKAHEHFWDLFSAVCSSGATPRLRELHGSKFQLQKWLTAATPYINFFADLGALRDLNLELELPQTYVEPTTLTQLLKSVPFLQSLQLNLIPEYHGIYLTLVNTIPSNSHWRYLRHLFLHGFETTEDYLRSFLVHHANTLHSLELGNILFRHPDSTKAGSWIEFFLFLNQSMRLKSVKFDGKLSNCVDESWYADSHDSVFYSWPDDPDICDCLKHRIERFITVDEPCPFEPLAEDADLTPYFNLPWMFETDFSWKFQKSDLGAFNDSDSDF
ncbi:hypothetical protein N431DRAFT_548813 [Stipitochalara longipes BDJ]|nr:hypothetical protein N431DRAFT_548813 [Stipitochalara longipes BDJ]